MNRDKIKITQVRSALIIIEIKGKKFLIDPWLAPKGSQPPYPCPIQERMKFKNPLVDLPMPVDKILENVEAIFVTHLHFDHFDEYAEKYIDKGQLIYCQNKEDKLELISKGFKNVVTFFNEPIKVGDFFVHRIEGLHSENPEIVLGKASGFIFECPKLKKLYICGDTIYYDGVKKAIEKHKPDIIVVNACAATTNIYGRLIMNDSDVLQVCKQAPNATVVISHMDTVNHLTITREDMRKFIKDNNLSEHVWMPDDGESREF